MLAFSAAAPLGSGGTPDIKAAIEFQLHHSMLSRFRPPDTMRRKSYITFRIAAVYRRNFLPAEGRPVSNEGSYYSRPFQFKPFIIVEGQDHPDGPLMTAADPLSGIQSKHCTYIFGRRSLLRDCPLSDAQPGISRMHGCTPSIFLDCLKATFMSSMQQRDSYGRLGDSFQYHPETDFLDTGPRSVRTLVKNHALQITFLNRQLQRLTNLIRPFSQSRSPADTLSLVIGRAFKRAFRSTAASSCETHHILYEARAMNTVASEVRKASLPFDHPESILADATNTVANSISNQKAIVSTTIQLWSHDTRCAERTFLADRHNTKEPEDPPPPEGPSIEPFADPEYD